MSPGPTIAPVSSLAVVPEMNSRLPTRTAGENVYRSGHGPPVIISRVAIARSWLDRARSAPSQREPLDFPRLRLGQIGHELDGSGVLADVRLDDVGDLVVGRRAREVARLEHDVRLQECATRLLVRRALSGVAHEGHDAWSPVATIAICSVSPTSGLPRRRVGTCVATEWHSPRHAGKPGH